MPKRISLLLIVISFAFPASALAQDASGDLDQCANGPLSAMVSCAGPQWQNGNLNGNQAHWFEGDSVSYRLKLANLVPGTSYTATIQWDTTKAGKHALDYLTSYNRSETTSPTATDRHANANDACSDYLGSCGPASTFPIPADPSIPLQTDWNPGSQQIGGDFTMWGGTLTGTSGYTATGDLMADSSSSINITFTASSASAVLAWGGHIATRKDWGIGNSAIAISGSPYHMRLLNLSPPDRGGNQDRSLTADAVIYPAMINIAKVVAGQDAPQESFGFTAGGTGLTFAGAGTFQLSDGQSITSDDIISFDSPLTVTEDQLSRLWSVGVTCSTVIHGLPGSTGSATPDSSAHQVSFSLEEGDIASCTFTNTFAKDTPSLSTDTGNHSSDTAVTVGGTISDTATVSGGFAPGDGTVTFELFGPGQSCSEDTPIWTVANVPLTEDANNPGTFTASSGDYTATAVGGYTWVASYSGDSTDNAVARQCPAPDDEISQVVKAQPELATSPSAQRVGVGHGVTDTATVSGGYNPSGAVSFSVYGPLDLSSADGPVCDESTLAATLDGVALADGQATSAAFTPTAPGTYVFVAHYAGDDSNLGADGSCSDESEMFTAVQPLVAVTKSANQAHAYDGDTVSFTIKVTNPGGDPLSNVALDDHVAGTTHSCDQLSGPVGDANQDGNLDPGETWTYVCAMTVVHAEETSDHRIVNQVVASGTSVTSGDRITSPPATADVPVTHPQIAIDKSGPATAQAGDKVGYVLTVTNPGDASFDESTVVVSDAQCNGDPVSLIGKGGDTSPSSLDPGDVWTYSCSVQTNLGDTSVHNVATVTAADSLGKAVNATDDADTTLTQPAQLVLPERITPGRAQLLAPTGCQVRAFNARVKGTQIATVVFVLDGNVVKRVHAPDKKGFYTLRVNPARMHVGVHRLVANITFKAGSGTKPKTLRVSFQRCAKRLIKPRFTG